MGRDLYPHFQMWKPKLRQGKLIYQDHWQIDNRVWTIEWCLGVHRPEERLVMLSEAVPRLLDLNSKRPVCTVGSKPRQLACESG